MKTNLAFAFIKITTLFIIFIFFDFNFSSTLAQNNKYSFKKSQSQRKTSNSPEKIDFNIDARLFFGDGRKIKGKIKFKSPKKLIIRHQKGGITFTKSVSIENILSIEIKKWKSTFLKRNKKGEIFRFDVAEFDITLKDKQKLNRKGSLFPFLQSFEMKNPDGSVKLYTYWIDLLRKNGSWYTGLPTGSTHISLRCHRNVVKKIEFLTNQDTKK